MAEVVSIHQDLIPHWEAHQRSAEQMVERAGKTLTRLYVETSGQLQLDLTPEETPEAA